MELLLRLVTPRNTAAALGAALLLNAAWQLRFELQWRYNRMFYPPVAGVAPAGREILDEAEKREAARVVARHRRLLAELDEAATRGHDVRPLRLKADAALKLNTPSLRRQAVKVLTEVEMQIPRERRRYIPYGPTPAPGEDIVPQPTPEGAPAVEGARSPRKRSRRR